MLLWLDVKKNIFMIGHGRRFVHLNKNGNCKTQYSYTFINGNFYIPENSKLCISQCMIPYSWFNIDSTLYNNNSFSYVCYYGNGLSKTYTVTIPNGFYSISDIQQYLEVYMISQNQYFTNTITGQNLYYIYISSNLTYYSIQLICYIITIIIFSTNKRI